MARHINLPATFIMDANASIQSWNAECQWLLGLGPDEAIGHRFADLLSPGQDDAFMAQMAQAASKAAQREIKLNARDGTVIDARLTVAAECRTTDGSCDRYIAVIDTGIADTPESEDTDAALFRKFSESLPGPFYVLDQVGHLVLWNSVLEQVTQRTAEELGGSHALDFFEERESATIRQRMRNAFELGKSSVEATVVTKDGKRIPYLFNCARTLLDGMVCICGMGIDISEHKQAEAILHLHERAIHASVNGVMIARRHAHVTRIEFVNPAFADISGYSAEDAIGHDMLFMCDPEIDATEQRKIRNAIEQCRSVQAVFRNRCKSGALFWNDLKIAPVANGNGEVTHFVGVICDVTEAKHYETQLEHLANHDPLTGLANRNLLRDHLELNIQYSHRHETLSALAFIDVDNFKYINDNFGHGAGDQILRTIADRLRHCVRDSDTVARVGGDEFVIIFADLPSIAHAVDMLERVRRSIDEPILVDSQDIYVQVSIGVSVFPRDGSDAEALLRGADAAMYHAKLIGRNNYQFYSPELNAEVHQRLRMEAGLRSALDRLELFLLYQPKVDLKTGRIVGAEALVRWQHPVQGVVSPADFIPVAEETGLIVPLGEWVLSCACTVLKKLHADGFGDFAISVNLSSRQFKQRNFVERLADQLRAAGVQAQSLELELTEGQLMDNPAQTAHILSQLRTLGVRVSIDDFGTGYSSLSYLQKFPVDHIKIDRSFVRDIGKGNEDAIITRTIIALGHSLNVKVIAEGVETKEQLAFLRQHECDQIQGHYFSEPVSSQRLRKLLETKRVLEGV